MGTRAERRERYRRDRDILTKCGRPRLYREGTCRQLAGAGTPHAGFGPCKTHGSSDEHEGWVAAMTVARELNISPWEALLKNVRIAAGRAAWVDEQLDEAVRRNDGDMNKPEITKWLKESRLERSLVAKMAKAAIDAGVAERLVRQVELEGELVATAVVRALDALELTAEQRTLALEVAHRELLAADGDQTTTVHGSKLYDDRPKRTDTGSQSPPHEPGTRNGPTDWIPPDEPPLDEGEGDGGTEGDGG